LIPYPGKKMEEMFDSLFEEQPSIGAKRPVLHKHMSIQTEKSMVDLKI
jgi:hypothetical protein